MEVMDGSRREDTSVEEATVATFARIVPDIINIKKNLDDNSSVKNACVGRQSKDVLRRRDRKAATSYSSKVYSRLGS